MKRLIAILLAGIYLCFTTGVTLHQHYCMGKFVRTTLWHQGDAHHCSRCGMEKKGQDNDCCHDFHVQLKANLNQLVVAGINLPTPPPAFDLPALQLFPFANPAYVLQQIAVVWPPKPPDADTFPPRFLRNCSFLI